MQFKIAILITCHNRIKKTLDCLRLLHQAVHESGVYFDIFLVDDGSTDGTSSAVNEKFPFIKIINGTGNLFWNQGMRLAWKTAISHGSNYDYFLWLNNDSFLEKDALIHLFDCYNKYKKVNNKEAIIVGACKQNIDSSIFSYGLKIYERNIVPNGHFQTGNMMNGNVVLVSNIIFNKIGILSEKYTHAMGDIDYGLRAIEAGFDLVSTKKYVAICESNGSLPNWCNPKISLKKRWEFLHSPLGLNLKEYKVFIKRFWPKIYFLSILKIYLRFLFPNSYNKLN